MKVFTALETDSSPPNKKHGGEKIIKRQSKCEIKL
jgi:hypothetical protein